MQYIILTLLLVDAMLVLMVVMAITFMFYETNGGAIKMIIVVG